MTHEQLAKAAEAAAKEYCGNAGPTVCEGIRNIITRHFAPLCEPVAVIGVAPTPEETERALDVFSAEGKKAWAGYGEDETEREIEVLLQNIDDLGSIVAAKDAEIARLTKERDEWEETDHNHHLVNQ